MFSLMRSCVFWIFVDIFDSARSFCAGCCSEGFSIVVVEFFRGVGYIMRQDVRWVQRLNQRFSRERYW